MVDLQVTLPPTSPQGEGYIISPVDILLQQLDGKSKPELIIQIIRMDQDINIMRFHNYNLQQENERLSRHNTPNEPITFGSHHRDASTETPNINYGSSVEVSGEETSNPDSHDADAQVEASHDADAQVEAPLEDDHLNDPNDDSNVQDIEVVTGYWHDRLVPVADYLRESDLKIEVSKHGIVIIYRKKKEAGEGYYHFMHTEDRNNRKRISAYPNDIHTVIINEDIFLPPKSIIIDGIEIDAIVSNIININGDRIPDSIIEDIITEHIPQDIIDGIIGGRNRFQGIVTGLRSNYDGSQYIFMKAIICGKYYRVFSTFSMSQLTRIDWKELEVDQELCGILDINTKNNSLVGKDLYVNS